MKIRMRTLAAGPNGVLEVGKTYDIEDKEAKQLIEGRYAVSVEDPAAEKSKRKKEELPDGLKLLAGGYYELPNGEKVQGKEAAIEAMKALEGGNDNVGNQNNNPPGL